MKQRVEILKTLYRGAEILILDEPTAVLTPQEVEQLLDIFRDMKKQGKTIIFITHKLNETKAVADSLDGTSCRKIGIYCFDERCDSKRIGKSNGWS